MRSRQELPSFILLFHYISLLQFAPQQRQREHQGDKLGMAHGQEGGLIVQRGSRWSFSWGWGWLLSLSSPLSWVSPSSMTPCDPVWDAQGKWDGPTGEEWGSHELTWTLGCIGSSSSAPPWSGALRKVLLGITQNLGVHIFTIHCQESS